MFKESGKAHFMYRQLMVTPPEATQDKVNLTGQVGIITGGNAGLGFQASRQLLHLGLPHLILPVRDQAKGEAAKKALLQETPGAKVDIWSLDMSNYDSIIAFVNRCKQLPRLDFVLANAGIVKPKLELNKITGNDEVVQVNYLSTMLLTILMLPVLAEKKQGSKMSRIVITGSETADWAKFKERKSDPILPAFNNPKNFDFEDRYYTSKLLQQLALAELFKRIPAGSVIVSTVNPGFCYGSTLHNEINGVLGSVLAGVKRVVGRSTEVGARTLTDAVVVQGPESHANYLSDCQIKSMAEMAKDPKQEALRKKLWDETMAELSFADASGVLNRLNKGAA